MKRRQRQPSPSKDDPASTQLTIGGKAPIGTIGVVETRDGRKYSIDARGVIRRLRDEEGKP